MAPQNHMDAKTQTFVQARPRLRGIAYRMLGSLSDADDAVQDVFLKWQDAAHDVIENPEAWLVSTCTRRCIDILRAAHKTRVDYVGTWLPEPVIGEAPFDVGEQAELASSLTMAFLLLLERLEPVERAAYLLREVFDYDYDDVAFAVGKNEVACRQIVSRAKKRLADQQVDDPPPPQRHETLLAEFLEALQSGETERFSELLSDDVELMADGGGKVIATEKIITTPAAVAKFLSGVWKAAWWGYEMDPVTVNGNAGAIMREDGVVIATLSLSMSADGKCSKIHVVRNPDKLSHITAGGQ